MTPSAVFVPAVALQTKISLSQQIFEKSWEYVKNVYTFFVELDKAYVRVKSFGEFCGGTVLTAACYWPSSPVQKFVSVSGELNHDRSPLVLDSNKVSPLLFTVCIN